MFRSGEWRTVLALAAVLAFSSNAIAHGGGLDDRGCHNDRSAGDYHCHQGEYEDKSFDSKAALDQSSNLASSAGPNAYEREDYHRGWVDHDSDCQDVREEVLISESQVPVEFASQRECDVVSGRWGDLYSGQVFTDPSELHIDHLVPLKEAHVSGAHKWSNGRKHAYANDLSSPATLIAVSASENMSKGARDPSEWMPSNDSFHCEYIQRWIAIKEKWGLKMDAEERRSVRRHQQSCQ